ncbi:MAG: cytidylate kinase-like family protein [Deltaproteobacteria bacterium]|nr:MAG: cytidylate kinase-like family protein [Deltaproteobacteria bacterium]
MNIITISTDRYSKGKEIAEMVAQKLGYECVSREVILSAANEFGVPETKLLQTIMDTPTILNMFSRDRQRYMAYIKAVVADYMLRHEIVYHGLVGHPIVRGVSHVLKTRIIANMEDRIRLEMERENISEEKAGKIITALDEQQKKWGKAVYGIDVTNPIYYDLIINVGHIGADDTEDAVETIISTAGHKKFQPNTYSINCMKNIALSCRVRAVLIDKDPRIEVKSDKGSVYIYTKTLKRKSQKQGLAFKEEIMKIDGVEHVEVYSDRETFLNFAQGQ